LFFDFAIFEFWNYFSFKSTEDLKSWNIQDYFCRLKKCPFGIAARFYKFSALTSKFHESTKKLTSKCHPKESHQERVLKFQTMKSIKDLQPKSKHGLIVS